MKRKFGNAFIGAISIILGLVVAFVLTPLYGKILEKQTEVVKIKKLVEKGVKIEEENIEMIKIGAYNLSDNIIKKKEEVVGKYAKTELFKDSYVIKEAISDIPIEKDTYLDNIHEDKLALSITVQSFAAGLSSKLLKGDIVSVVTTREEEGENVSEIPDALNYVEVLSTTEEGGSDKEKNPLENKEKDKEKKQLATVTLLVGKEQAEELVSYENKRTIHLALKCRKNEELKKKLLDEQEKVVKEMMEAKEGKGKKITDLENEVIKEGIKETGGENNETKEKEKDE